MLAGAGDHLQIRTVGIAVDSTRIPRDNPALQALVRANQRALQTIAEQPRLAVEYTASFLDRLTREEAQQHYERHIRPFFSSEARSTSILPGERSARSRPNSASRQHPSIRCTSWPAERQIGHPA